MNALDRAKAILYAKEKLIKKIEIVKYKNSQNIYLYFDYGLKGTDRVIFTDTEEFNKFIQIVFNLFPNLKIENPTFGIEDEKLNFKERVILG